MGTVVIAGAGELGGAVAYALAASDRVRRVVLIDPAGAAAEGKALDIRQAGAVEGFHAVVDGTTDVSRAIDAGVCVIADRFEKNQGEWQGEEGLALITRLSPYLGAAPIVFAGHSQTGLLHAAAREAGLPARRLIGSAVDALQSSLAAIVAMEAGCSPADVTLAIVGTPPAGLVVVWSEASIAGYSLDRVLSQVQMARLASRLPRLWPPGPYTLGAAAARVAAAALDASRRSFCLLTVLDGELGVRNRVAALPCLLGDGGIRQVQVPDLSPRERVQLDTALRR